MKSEIEIFVQFGFKGETRSPAMIINLDQQMEQQGHLSPFIPALAKAGDIGPYSYEYEVMESVPVVVKRAEGAAVSFVVDEQFDVRGFEMHWRQQREFQKIEEIAQQYLSSEQLEQLPQWRIALVAAYQLGKGTS